MATQTHHFPADLKYTGHKSRARWAIEPKGTAVVFVHGFGGSSTNSWTNFSGLVPSHQEYAGVDLIFFGYDSLHQHLHPVAADLRKLLSDLFEDPTSRIINQSLDVMNYRPATFKYNRVVVAAHSSGSVVARLALLEATQAQAAWAKQTALVCFAPAHNGVRIADLASESISLLRIPIAGAVAKFFIKTLPDLQIGSPLLASLKAGIDEAIEAGAKHLVAFKVVFARNDPVVETTRFCRDPPPIFVENKTHLNVCRPDFDFLDPIRYVMEALS